MVITKREEVPVKYSEENSLLGKSVISTYSIFWGWGRGSRLFEFEWEWEGGGVGWGGCFFEAGRLLTFSAFSVGAYSRWALIRGWALI